MDQGPVKEIMAAAQLGNKKAMQEFIAKGKVGVVDEEGTTPLMYAAASGREEILRLLLERECLRTNNLENQMDEEEAESGSGGRGPRYIDRQNSYGWTALMQAASYGHTGSVLYLLQQGADTKLVNAWGVSALVLASQGGHFGVVNTLLSRGAMVQEVQKSGEELVSGTLTPLMAASQCGHVGVVRELLGSDASIDVKLQATGWTALMLASLNNRVSVVEALLEGGANRGNKDVLGKSAKDLSSTHGHKNVNLLLAGSKVPKNVSDGEFVEAVSKGNAAKVGELLREKGALVQMEFNKDGVTALMLASNKGHKEVCEILLQSKAEVNLKDRKYGWTALLHATHYKRYEVVELLCNHGADVNVKDNSGSSPYDVARKLGDVQMIELIHKVTIKMLQDMTTPPSVSTPTDSPTDLLTPSSSIDVSSSPAQEVAEATPTPVPPSANPQPDPGVTKSIDLGELKAHFQRAYDTPAANLKQAGGGLERPSLLSPGNSRFPSSKRNRTDASRSQPSPFPPSPISPAVSPSTASSSRSWESRSPRASVPLFLKGSGRPGGLSDKSPSSLKSFTPPLKMPSERAPLRTGPAQRQNSGGIGEGLKGRYPRVRETGSSGNNTPFNFSPRVGLPAKGRAVTKSRSSVPGLPVATAPASKPVAGSRQGLRSVLAGVSLLHYLSLFEDQEVDEESFWTLGDKDLSEMGITNAQDRSKIVSLISSRGNSSEGERPKSMPLDGYVFQ